MTERTPRPWLDREHIRFMLEDCETWAIVGLSGNPDRTAYRIARFLQERGKRIVPIHPCSPSTVGASGLMNFQTKKNGKTHRIY